MPIQVAAALNSSFAFGWLDAAGIAIWSLGLFFEAVGDLQLAQFKPECFTAVVEPEQAEEFANSDLVDLETDLLERMVRVTGEIQERDGQIEIRITDVTKQLKIVELPEANRLESHR